jgi:UrcA family protein
MTMQTASTMFATGALALVLATSASAQSYASPTEEVIVRAPQYGPQRSEIGAPIENVSLSREVRFDDLDLRTAWGARALRDRVRETAMNLCQQLENQYVTMDDNRPCYRTAYEDAMDQAETAIRDARLSAAR